MSKTIDQIADDYFGGSLGKMAQVNNITPQLLSRWKKLGYVVVNGVVMSPRRELRDVDGNLIRDLSSGQTDPEK